MDSDKINSAARASQESPLENFISDLRGLRRRMVPSERFHRSGILAGQLLILASHYQNGNRPSNRKLKRFLHFITREAA